MNRLAYIVFSGILLFAGARSLDAQQVNPRVPPAPPPADTTAAPKPSPTPTPAPPDPATTAPPPAPAQPIDLDVPPPPPSVDEAPDPPAAPSGPVFDPLHAQRSLDVGKFYLNKGAYDAAIDRFIESSNYQPSLAAPWRFLGDAYEKKHEYAKAADAYNKYLQILPNAPDAAKIKKQISDLEEKTAQDSPKKTEP